MLTMTHAPLAQGRTHDGLAQFSLSAREDGRIAYSVWGPWGGTSGSEATEEAARSEVTAVIRKRMGADA